MSQDVEHLRLLSIFHYVYAGLIAVFSCFPLVYIAMGIAAFAGAMGSNNGPPPAIMGSLFVVMGLVGFVLVLALAVLNAYAGKCLTARKHYTFCIVVSALNCMAFPFGTALGVFTIVTLQRPGVRAMFGNPNTSQT